MIQRRHAPSAATWWIALGFLLLSGLRSPAEPTNRIFRTDSLERLAADLQAFIPPRMAEAEVPGLAVAVIRDGHVAWTGGFGVANALTGRPVQAHTIFPAGSLGKPVFAYATLHMAEEGMLELDQPLSGLTPNSLLPDSTRHQAITTRHVLSHTSGLSNNMKDQEGHLLFEPGQQFRYSGLGFMYLQGVLTNLSGRSLDAMAWEHAFQPIGMTHSYYGRPLHPMPAPARDHVKLGWGVGVTLIGLVLLLAICLGGLMLWNRWRLGTWKLLRRDVLAGLVVALLMLGAVFHLWVPGGLTMAAWMAGYLLATLVVAAFIGFCGSFISARIRQARTGQPAGTVRPVPGWILLGLALALGLFARFSVPLPDWYEPQGNAAYSLRTTVSDLARFLIELEEAQHLDPDRIEAMTSPQVVVNDFAAWGLGIGIARNEATPALWHWGDNIGSKGLMVYYPGRGVGVVVLCNGANGRDLVRDVAARVLWGAGRWGLG